MKELFSLMLCTFSSFALAHHSAAVFYHMDQNVTLTVTEFRMGNPHIRVYFEMENDEGKTEQWMAEGGSRTVLLRHGSTGDEIQIGDVITVNAHPSREDENIVHMTDITFADGEQRYAEDINPAVTDRLLEERRQRD